jgi:mono/diheme cytochrome c family protein
MWNHATNMITAMQEKGVAWPTLSTKDLADLIAFLYFVPFPDPAGDPEVGRQVFAKRTCADCHVAGQNSSHPGPDLIGGTAAGSPEALVAAMWNHAPVMKEAILQAGRPWPELSGSELRDLFAYLCSTVKQDDD